MNTSVKVLFLVYSVDGLRCFCITSVKYPTEGDWYNFINSPSFRVNWYFFDTIFLLPWPQRFFFSPYCFATRCLRLAVRSLFHEQKISRKASGTVMYQEFVVCNVAGNCITNTENSTIFYFKSVSTWQEEPTAHVRSA